MHYCRLNDKFRNIYMQATLYQAKSIVPLDPDAVEAD